MAVYATTDLHGRFDLYEKIKATVTTDDKVFFLGDAGDRGPDGWKLIKAIYEDDQFTYIKGNHEDMLVNAIRAYRNNPECESKAYKLLERNGGAKTFEDWWKDGQDYGWIDKLGQLPLRAEYRNTSGVWALMSHAGYTPWTDPDDENTLLIPSDFELIWNRDHFYDEEYDEWKKGCVAVHGHTPIIHLAKYLCDPSPTLLHGAYWYDNRRKVCIDNLSAYSDVACLLNLDTFEEILIVAD
jgi:hypothetical protein